MSILADIAIIAWPWRTILLTATVIVGAFLVLHAVWVACTPRHLTVRERHGAISRVAYVLFVLVTVVLAATAFGNLWRGVSMKGYALLAHVAASGAFLFLLLCLSLFFLPRGTDRTGQPHELEHRWWLARWSAWMLVGSSIVAAATMLVSMLPLADTNGLLLLAQVHRVGGLAVLVSLILHVYAMSVTRAGWR
ncbi:MAG: hypothetical protein KatS3mg111_0985 [Pirellulaceae bacterium]|nr:MAG: hypothetical protein KatS3mg111_0985 [Pirellulaceae bacterium]